MSITITEQMCDPFPAQDMYLDPVTGETYRRGRHVRIWFNLNGADKAWLTVLEDGTALLSWRDDKFRVGYIIGPHKDAIMSAILAGPDGHQTALSVALDYAGMDEQNDLGGQA